MGKAATVHTEHSGPPEVLMIEASKLRFAREAPVPLKLNVRKSSDRHPMSDAELEATIRAHGVLIPLMFKQVNGEAYVTAGNRRLRIFRKIHGEGTNAKLMAFNTDHFSGDPREIAMATNVSLPPHPVDRYEVISAFAKEGMKPKDVQERFGLTQRQYAQTMRLAGLSPKIREAWRDGAINAETAQAFALSDDPKHQDKILEQVQKNAHQGRIEAHAVRHLMVGKQHDVGPMVEFVGVAEAVKAGIVVNEDMFGTLKHTVSDVAKLKKLVNTRLQERCKRLTDAGWAWAMLEEDAGNNRWSYSSIAPAKKAVATADLKTKLEALSAVLQQSDDPDFSEAERKIVDEIEDIEEDIKASGWTPEQRKKSGCFVKIGRDGSLIIEYGRVKPEERAKVAASERKAPAAKKKAAGSAPAISNALAERLAAQLTKAAAQTIAKETNVALAAMIAGFASMDDVCGVRTSGRDHAGKMPTFTGMFDAQRKSTLEQMAVMLAQVAAGAISFRSFRGDQPPLKDKSAVAICAALNANALNAAVREHFDAKDYFASVSRDSIVAAVKESMGTEHAGKVAKMTKADAAKFATLHVPKTNWLPEWLRTPHYDFKPKK